MERTDQEPEMDSWHLLLAVGWGFLTAVAFIGDVYRYSDKGRPVHPNDEKFVAMIRVAEDSGLSPKEQEREMRRQELRNESILAYRCGPGNSTFADFLYILPCGLFFGASCVLTFCGPKGRVAGAALGLSVLWIWAFQHCTFWHPRWM
jgi:hypothetical protein